MATRRIDQPKEFIASCDECGRDALAKAFTKQDARKEAVAQGFRWGDVNHFLCPQCQGNAPPRRTSDGQ